MEQLAEEFRNVANEVKVHAKREDIPTIRAWVPAQEGKSFRVRQSFVVRYYPAYMAFPTGLRTGKFLLWLVGLRRMAVIFCVIDKDRCQWLVVQPDAHGTDARIGIEGRGTAIFGVVARHQELGKCGA